MTVWERHLFHSRYKRRPLKGFNQGRNKIRDKYLLSKGGQEGMSDSSPPNPTVYRSLCLLSPISCHSLFSVLLSFHQITLCSVKANPFFSLITHFFSHSDLTAGEEACANIEIPIEIYGDTLNCLLTFAFDKKDVSQFAYSQQLVFLPSCENTYLPEWKFRGSRACIFLLQFLCANMLPSLQTQQKCPICALCLLPGKLTAPAIS